MKFHWLEQNLPTGKSYHLVGTVNGVESPACYITTNGPNYHIHILGMAHRTVDRSTRIEDVYAFAVAELKMYLLAQISYLP